MRKTWSRLTLHRRVLLSLVSGDRSISGVLVDERGPLLVLRDARLHAEGLAPDGLVLDGETIVEVARVDFAQLLPPVDPTRPGT